MGALAGAMIFGACVAVIALVAGQSFLMALAIYSGCGVLGVAILVAICMINDAARSKKSSSLLQSDRVA